MATNWFPHDSTAGMDQHVLLLRSEWGSAGYGMFWLALEAMYETSDGMLDAAALPALSIRMAESKETVTRFFDYCLKIGLFIEKEGKIYSERLLEEKSRLLARSEAQRQRAENRWKKEKNNKSSATAVPRHRVGNAPTVPTVPTGQTTPVRVETEVIYDEIDQHCKSRGLVNGVNVEALDVICAQYAGKVRMKAEVPHLIAWLLAKGFREVTAERIGGWFKQEKKIQKREELRQMEWKEAQINPAMAERRKKLKAKGDGFDTEQSVQDFLSSQPE